MGLRENKLGAKILSAICSSLIPAIIYLLAACIWRKWDTDDTLFTAFWTVVGVLGMILSYIIFYAVLPRIKFFRNFKEYEGRWLEIIPDLKNRPCSIIDFTFNQSSMKYEMIGFNFNSDLASGVEFTAYKFIERTFKDGFYFITNRTSECKNGLGKISFIKSNFDTLTRAEGYFFDSGSDNCSKKYDTILIKCDDEFFNSIGTRYRHMNAKNTLPIEIVRISKNFVDEEIRKYDKNRISHSPVTCPCKSKNNYNTHGTIFVK